MADAEPNKQTVIAVYSMAFNDKHPAEAVAQYVGSRYTQHNPQAPDGPEAFVEFGLVAATRFPRRATAARGSGGRTSIRIRARRASARTMHGAAKGISTVAC